MHEEIVKMENISKMFPGVLALDDVSLNLKSGEVLALLGENGAGKTTLMKILSGIYQQDSGNIEIMGHKMYKITPKKAQAMGVAIIHQELNMCAHLTVAENIFLGREKTRFGIQEEKKMHREAKKILERLNVDIATDTVVGSLPVSKQQMIEIAKALSLNAKILIMDEPTSALTSNEIKALFEVIHKLKQEGCGIIYISHRLEELQYIVDRVIIMRDGKYISTMAFSNTCMNEIITDMVGREIEDKYPRVNCPQGKKVLSVNNLCAGSQVRNVSFDLHEGEIVGIAGLMGAGRTETTRAIFGIDSKESGKIILDGKPVNIKNPKDAIRAGIALVPEDRKKDGLCTKLSICDNIALPNLDIICDRIGTVNSKKEHEIVSRTVDNLGIKINHVHAQADSLSGGNQQKVVVGKWLVRTSRVVIFDEPTRGIDVAAKVEIYHLMNQLKQSGIAVLFVSSEMPEIISISDRILVMCEGRITGELDAKQATQDLILSYATQFEKKRQEV